MPTGYVYEASIYCEECLPKDAERSDSNIADGECDTPEHCCECRIPIDDCGLTNHGVTYVLEKLEETLYEGPDQWNKVWCFPSIPAKYHTSDVKALVHGIRQDNANDRWIIVADALQDAGFDDERYLKVLREGVSGGVLDVERLCDAILGRGTDNDYYQFCRQVDITRKWAEDVENFYLGDTEGVFIEGFLLLTLPTAAVEELLDEFVNDENMTNNVIDWSTLRPEWENRTKGGEDHITAME